MQSPWRKSTASNPNGDCAEVAAGPAGAFRKASASQGASNCLEVGQGALVVGIRDTKEAHLGAARTVLLTSPDAWDTFLGKVRRGEIG